MCYQQISFTDTWKCVVPYLNKEHFSEAPCCVWPPPPWAAGQPGPRLHTEADGCSSRPPEPACRPGAHRLQPAAPLQQELYQYILHIYIYIYIYIVILLTLSILILLTLSILILLTLSNTTNTEYTNTTNTEYTNTTNTEYTNTTNTEYCRLNPSAFVGQYLRCLVSQSTGCLVVRIVSFFKGTMHINVHSLSFLNVPELAKKRIFMCSPLSQHITQYLGRSALIQHVWS